MSSVKSYVQLKEKYDRIVVLIDMDCFYCQVEEFLDPERLAGKPIAVVQYLENAGIIAVNYAARALGVTRHMREKEAKAACKDLICVKVPSKNGKADLTKYRDAGYEVAKVLQTFTPLLERASIDEAYLDITENVAQKLQELRNNTFVLQPSNFANTFAVGYENIGLFVQDVTSSVDKNYEDVPEEDRKAVASSKLRLLIGASIVNEIRNAVKEKTKYECSAGIAHNKILAKLTCAFNKPNKQTLLPIESISNLFKDLPVNQVKSLGGKLGEEVCKKLNAKTMSDILKFTEGELQHHFQNRVGSWLYFMARGIDLEKVTPKFMSKSIAVSKNFRGKNEISLTHTLKFWLVSLAKEVVERLQKDEADCNRTAKQMIVSFTQGAPKAATGNVSSTRTVPLNGNSLNAYTAEQIAEEAFDTIKRNSAKFLKSEGTNVLNLNIKHLGISAGKFEDKGGAGGSKNLQDLLKNQKKKEVKPVQEAETSPNSRSAAMDAVKKFEKKSPKLLMKTPKLSEIVQKMPKTSKIDDEKETSIISSMSFNGENSIKGEKTLRHWINELFKESLRKIESLESQKKPNKFTVTIKQLESQKSFHFPLESFKDNFIDVDLILETVKQIDEETQKIKQPIIYLEVLPNDFIAGKVWNWKLKDENNSKVENSETIESEIEEEILMDDSVMDEEFHELVRNGLDEIEADPKEDDVADEPTKVSPNYSPTYDDTSNDSKSPVKNSNEDFLPVQDPNPPTPGPSYMHTYAEFQLSNLPIEILNPKEPCPECGKMIGKLDIVSHLDHHLAFQIANEQREEFRMKQKTSVTSTQTAPKKVLKAKNQQIKVPTNSITNYVKKTQVQEQISDPENEESKIKCEQCPRFILPDEYVSHLDYHFAQKLRDEERKLAKPAVQKAERPVKRPASAQKNLPKMKSVKTYFSNNS